MVRGRKVAALGACEPEVTLAGGTYIEVKPTGAYVDGTMVSAKGWTGLAAFMRESLKVRGPTLPTPDTRTGRGHSYRPSLYPTRFSGTCPAKCASIPSRSISAMLIRASIVELPMCGVMKTFGRS